MYEVWSFYTCIIYFCILHSKYSIKQQLVQHCLLLLTIVSKFQSNSNRKQHVSFSNLMLHNFTHSHDCVVRATRTRDHIIVATTTVRDIKRRTTFSTIAGICSCLWSYNTESTRKLEQQNRICFGLGNITLPTSKLPYNKKSCENGNRNRSNSRSNVHANFKLELELQRGTNCRFPKLMRCSSSCFNSANTDNVKSSGSSYSYCFHKSSLRCKDKSAIYNFLETQRFCFTQAAFRTFSKMGDNGKKRVCIVGSGNW